jgi:ankyrin repeat protein
MIRPPGIFLLALTCSGIAFSLDPQALLDAARSDDRAVVVNCLRQGFNPNLREQDGATALAWAATRDNLDIATLLLKAGADPNLTNELGIGPLALAVANGSAPLLSLLLSHRADPNIPRENGETPLMTATRLQRIDLIQLLLASGASVNARENKFGQTALMWAAGQPATVRLLLQSGTDFHATTRSWLVKYTFYLPTTATLGKTGIPWNNDGDYTVKQGGLNALFFAVQNNDMESVRLLLDAGIDVNAPAADGATPLLAALYKWDPTDGVFVPGRTGPATAGSSQRFHPNIRIANLLLDRGASVHAVDGVGYTPLHGAALAVAKAAHTGTRQKGAYGQTAAALALGADDAAPEADLHSALALVSRLLAAGANPNPQTIYPTAGPAGDVRINPAPPGSSPLHIAASSGSLPLVELLTAKGANPNLLRRDGHSPFTVSVLAGDVAIARLLLARGANCHGRWDPLDKIPDPVEAITLARQNQSILHLAALAGKPEMLELLHSQGADLFATNAQGETPLQLADHQERYREAIQRQNADGDPEKLRKVLRPTAATETLKRLARGATNP